MDYTAVYLIIRSVSEVLRKIMVSSHPVVPFGESNAHYKL